MKKLYIVPTTTAEYMQTAMPLCVSGIDSIPGDNGGSLSKKHHGKSWGLWRTPSNSGSASSSTDDGDWHQYSPWED